MKSQDSLHSIMPHNIVLKVQLPRNHTTYKLQVYNIHNFDLNLSTIGERAFPIDTALTWNANARIICLFSVAF